MAEINFDAFVRWAKSKFDDVLIQGEEVRLNSPWAEDTKHHLWCNVYGGKWHRKYGVYRCFKTDKIGTIPGLVMAIDNCSHDEAMEILEIGCNLYDLEAELEAFFQNKEVAPKPLPKTLGLPAETYLITDLLKNNDAEAYLTKRHIPVDNLMFCLEGDYRDRIIIPYYDNNGKLIYYNGRYIGNNKKVLRYLGPSKLSGVGKGDVIYVKKWMSKGTRLYLTEGEFDAMTLTICGYPGAACGGKYLSDAQLELLKNYQICMCFDTDKAGYEAQMSGVNAGEKFANHDEQGYCLANKLIWKGFNQLTYVRAPTIYKDWNDMMIDVGQDMVAAYIAKCEKPFDVSTMLQRMCHEG